MRMAELSERSGIPVATVKFYLREGLLHPGVRTSQTQSSYDDTHVRRLGMIRALMDVGGLSVSRTSEVIAAMADQDRPLGEVLHAAQLSVSRFAATAGPLDRERALARVDELAARRGWTVHEGNPGRLAAADVLATLDHVGVHSYDVLITACATAAEIVAEADLEEVAATVGGRESVVETVVVGTVLGDVLLMAMRRMVQEHISRKQYPHTP